MEQAFIKGAAQGFFMQLSKPKDIGNAVAPYLTKKDAYQLAQVAKLPAKQAKEMRDEIIEQFKCRK